MVHPFIPIVFMLCVNGDIHTYIHIRTTYILHIHIRYYVRIKRYIWNDNKNLYVLHVFTKWNFFLFGVCCVLLHKSTYKYERLGFFILVLACGNKSLKSEMDLWLPNFSRFSLFIFFFFPSIKHFRCWKRQQQRQKKNNVNT